MLCQKFFCAMFLSILCARIFLHSSRRLPNNLSLTIRMGPPVGRGPLVSSKLQFCRGFNRSNVKHNVFFTPSPDRGDWQRGNVGDVVAMNDLRWAAFAARRGMLNSRWEHKTCISSLHNAYPITNHTFNIKELFKSSNLCFLMLLNRNRKSYWADFRINNKNDSIIIHFRY